MARQKIPNPMARRDLVEGRLDPARALAIAEAYLEADQVVDAVAFLRKAEARERLEALRDDAVREGDAFLLKEVSTALGEPPGMERWDALAAAAEAAGRERYATEARRQARRKES